MNHDPPHLGTGGDATLRERYNAFVGGHWESDGSQGEQPVFNPSTGGQLATVVSTGAAEVERAAELALKAQPVWSDSGWERRAATLRQLADDLETQTESFARLDALNAGIAIRGARRDVANGVRLLRYFAGLASEAKGQTLEATSRNMNLTLREPYRVVGKIVPFNHPIQFAVGAVAAPLAAGNAVILKPSDLTPVSALHFAALADAHLPSGLLSVLPGGGETGAALVDSPLVPRIGFTGSVRVGQEVMRQSARHVKVVTLELGGKNAMVVGPNVDPELAAEHVVVGMNLLRTAGQSCGSTSRVFVHEHNYDSVETAVARAFREIRLGDALSEETDMGPLASRAQQERVLGFIESAASEGGTLLAGGRVPEDLGGYFVEPTVFGRVRDDTEIAREEVFGPAISLHTWADEHRLLSRINRSPLGLTANILTNDLSLAQRLAVGIDAGYIWVNGRGQRPLGAPFGGYKLSGLGHENSLEELLSYTRVKNVNMSSPS